MKKITITLFFLMPFFIFSQERMGKVAEKVQAEQSRLGKFKPFDIFKTGFESARNNYSEETKGGIVVTFDKAGIASIYSENPKQMELNIPLKENGETISLDLLQVDIFGPNFKAITSDGRDITNEMDRGKHYHGTVSGNSQSLVSISVFKNEIVGFITNGEGNYTIGKLKDSNTKHIINKDSNLRTTQEFNCGTEDDGVGYTAEQLNYDSSRRAPGDPVGVYVEAGQSVYNSFGSNLALTTNFLNGLFGQSYLIYANEGITMYTSSMLIWTTPDPYPGGGSSSQLSAFQAQTGAFQGDIGHLVEYSAGGTGGIAAGFEGLCNPDTDKSLCYTQLGDNTVINVPSYSRVMKVITHEMGHLLGSRHTHACVWNGDNTQIDDYGNYYSPATYNSNSEGASCVDQLNPKLNVTPTIMSYYDSRGFGGFSMGNGFGIQPGNVIRNTISNAVCLNCTGPTITCPADIALECGDDKTPTNTGLATTTNGCGNVSVAFSDVNTPGNCPGNYTIKRTWTATDEVGNQVQCVQTITVADTTAPVAPAPPADLNVQCATDVPSPVDLTATDKCDGDITVSPSSVVTPGNCDNQFTMVRTWTFVDKCGNQSSVSQTITVKDDTPPDAPTPPADLNLQCADDVPAPVDLTANDNCNGDITVSPTEVKTPGACINDFTLVRTWTFVDSCGNQSSVSQTITVKDDTSPTALCKNITVQLDEKGHASIVASDIDGGSNDNCGIASLSIDKTDFTCDDVGEQTVTLTVTDDCGNQSSCTATVTVEDNVPPEAICQNVTTQINSSGFARLIPELFDNGSNDACGIESIEIDREWLYCDDIGLNEITLTVTDVNGNVSTCIATVNLKDWEAPQVESDPYLNIQVSVGEEFVVPSFVQYGHVTVSDNCMEGVKITQSPEVGTVLTAGTYTIVVTAQDAFGNSNSTSFELIIKSPERLNDKDSQVIDKSIKFYPNPFNESITISNPKNLDLIDAGIFDMTGRKIMSFDLENCGLSKELDLSKLASATYFITIRAGDGQITKPLIKK